MLHLKRSSFSQIRCIEVLSRLKRCSKWIEKFGLTSMTTDMLHGEFILEYVVIKSIYFGILIHAQMNLIFKIPWEEIFQTKEGACFCALPAKTIDHVNFWLISNTLSKITDPKHKYPDSLQTKSCEREWKWFQKVWMQNWTYEWTDKETSAILNKVSEQVNDAMRLIRRERNFSKNIKRVKLRLMHFGGGIRTGRLIWPKRSCQLKAQLNKLIRWKMSV